MRTWLCVAFCTFSFFALAAEKASELEKVIGLKGTYNQAEKVFKATFPRTDIKVSVSGLALDPFMGLTSWVAFSPMENDNYIVMGDLVLFEDEVNSVMSTLFEHNLDITALHNHFFFDHPKVYFMHIEGVGLIRDLASGIKAAIEKTTQIRQAFPEIRTEFEGAQNIAKKNSITVKKLESIFDMEAQSKEGMAKFIIGRKVKIAGFELGKEMGINTWAAFGGSDQNAFVDGDFAVTEKELQPVLKALRKGNINIVAIHNHMVGENPRLIFLHFFGIGDVVNLAETIKEASQNAL